MGIVKTALLNVAEFLESPQNPGLIPITLTLVWIALELYLVFHIFIKYQSAAILSILPEFTDQNCDDMIWEIKTPQSTPDPLAFFEGWFLGTPSRLIGKGSLKVWISDMFFKKDYRRLNNRQANLVHRAIQEMEDFVDYEFQDLPDVPMIKQTIPMSIFYRPFAFYGFTRTMAYATNTALKKLGFVFRDHGHVTAYYRKGNSLEPPIIFCHGLGIGIATYIRFVAELIRHYPSRTILLPEMPVIAMRLQLKPCLPEDFGNAFGEICADLQIEDATIIGHSYGTIMMRWIDMFCPGLVKRRVFVDPICFRLWTHHIAENFFHKSPDHAFAYIVKFVAAMEPGVAVYLRDYFVWFQNTYFTRLLPTDCTIIFAENDHLVNCENAVSYLLRFPHPTRKIEITKGAFHGKMITFGDLQPIFDAVDTKYI